MKTVPSVLVFATLLAAVPSPAHADLVVARRPSAGRSSPSSRTEFYGWGNILVGELGLGSAVAIVALSSGSRGGGNDAGGYAGLSGALYLFGGPILHAIEGDCCAKSLGAFGLLVGLPATGALIGYGASSGCESDDCGGEAAAWGAITGAALAPIVDGLALGWKSGRSERAELPAVMPYSVPIAGGATVGIMGTF